MHHQYPYPPHYPINLQTNEQINHQQQSLPNPAMPYGPQTLAWPQNAQNSFYGPQKALQTKNKAKRKSSTVNKNSHLDQLGHPNYSMHNYPYYGPVMMPGGYYYGAYPSNPYAGFPVEHSYGFGFMAQAPQNQMFQGNLHDPAHIQSSNNININSKKLANSDEECIQKKVFAENNKTFVNSSKVLTSTAKESSLPKRKD